MDFSWGNWMDPKSMSAFFCVISIRVVQGFPTLSLFLTKALGRQIKQEKNVHFSLDQQEKPINSITIQEISAVFLLYLKWFQI
jgi:hypothetical protein